VFFCDMCSPDRELSPLSLSQFWGALHPSVPDFSNSECGMVANRGEFSGFGFGNLCFKDRLLLR
jgi:hypothetical protein